MKRINDFAKKKENIKIKKEQEYVINQQILFTKIYTGNKY